MRSTLRALITSTLVCRWLVLSAVAQTATVIPANEAAAHIGEYATVEGVVAKVFTSKGGNTFLNIGPAYPIQTLMGWIPRASPANKSPILSWTEGKKRLLCMACCLYRWHASLCGWAGSDCGASFKMSVTRFPKRSSARRGTACDEG